MTILEAIISGLVQGLTEFLPVSSSGHLVLLHSFFGYTEPTLLFDIFLHVGTLLSVLVFFGSYIVSIITKKDIRTILLVVLATIPAVGVAVLFNDRIESFFSEPRMVAIFLLATSVFLFAAQVSQVAMKKERTEAGPLKAFSMGIAQALALFPGVSRSGSTISTGMLLGMKEEEAFRFSFLMSIPAILGALVFKLKDIQGLSEFKNNVVIYTAGTFTAFAIGLVSLYLLWKVLKVKRIFIFGIYCFVLGMVGVILW